MINQMRYEEVPVRISDNVVENKCRISLFNQNGVRGVMIAPSFCIWNTLPGKREDPYDFDEQTVFFRTTMTQTPIKSNRKIIIPFDIYLGNADSVVDNISDYAGYVSNDATLSSCRFIENHNFNEYDNSANFKVTYFTNDRGFVDSYTKSPIIIQYELY